jgi:hypothetical protein
MAGTNINTLYHTYMSHINRLINNQYFINNNGVEQGQANLNILREIAQIGRNRIISSLIHMRQAMELAPEFFIVHEQFYNLTAANGLTPAQADAARFQYLCAYGNVEELNKWVTDYVREHGINEFYFMANRPTRIPYLDYSLYPITTAIMWNDNPLLIRYLCSYGLELNITDEHRHFPEEAALLLPYFNPVAHLLPNAQLPNARLLNPYLPNYTYIRDHNDFQNIIREVNIITGERAMPLGWEPIQVVNEIQE